MIIIISLFTLLFNVNYYHILEFYILKVSIFLHIHQLVFIFLVLLYIHRLGGIFFEGSRNLMLII